MNAFDRELQTKIERREDLGAIEARLARQEQKTRLIVTALMILTVMAFALLLGHTLAPSWLLHDY
jgi:hypothetical protein